MNPLRTSGWAQGIHEQSSTKKHTLGCLRFSEDGRVYRYAKAGETLTVGYALNMATVTANHWNQTATAAAVGAATISFTIGATALTANMYDDGYFLIVDRGDFYRVKSHSVSAAGSEAISIILDDPIRVAVTTSQEGGLIPNPWSSITMNASAALGFAGIAPISVTSAYYFWAQVGGFSVGKSSTATSATGSVISLASTEGEVVLASGYAANFIGNKISYTMSSSAGWSPIELFAF